MSELMQRCDCRKPAPDHKTLQFNHDAIQCRGCRGWITGMDMLENRWGLMAAELRPQEMKR